MLVLWDILDKLISVLRQYVVIPARPPVKLPFYARGFEAQLNASLDGAWNSCFWAGFWQGCVFSAIALLLAKELFKKRPEKD